MGIGRQRSRGRVDRGAEANAPPTWPGGAFFAIALEGRRRVNARGRTVGGADDDDGARGDRPRPRRGERLHAGVRARRAVKPAGAQARARNVVVARIVVAPSTVIL